MSTVVAVPNMFNMYLKRFSWFLFIIYFVLNVKGDGCGMDVILTRHVENEGFHRELHSSVEIAINLSVFSDCVIVQRELMPPGLYVNPDELADLQRTGQVSGCVGSEVDTEAAKETAEPHEVFIYYTLKQLGNKLTGNFVMPFHLRYHKPLSLGGEEEVVLEAPAILLKCNPALTCLHNTESMLAPCIPCSREKCQWINIPYKTELTSINIKVPVGSLHQYSTVLVCTLVTTAAGSMYIIKLLLNYHW